MGKRELQIYGAREHNLKNLTLNLPLNQLVVITGLSGSGKSSLAFDTIYAEGQRRYIETLPSYARQFLGGLERPEVDKIDGLAPVIAIEQKTGSKNPRSTVGTITEIYDLLRLLYAKIADAYSFHTGERMVQYSDEQIQHLILENYADKKVILLAPVVKSRKGHYHELFESIQKQGFVKVRVDEMLREIVQGMKLDRYKVHDIEIVIDQLKINTEKNTSKRLLESIQTAMYHGNESMMLLIIETDEVRYFSRSLMCPTTGISYPIPEPNTFSFNSPKGACPNCNGIGKVMEIDLNKLIPDRQKSIKNGALAALGKYKKTWIFDQLELIAKTLHFSLSDPLQNLSEEAIHAILYGHDDHLQIESKTLGLTRNVHVYFKGIVHFIESQFQEKTSAKLVRWAKQYMSENDCTHCGGSRLRKEALFFKIAEKSIADVAQMNLQTLYQWLETLPKNLHDRQLQIAEEILKELQHRLAFLLDVGMKYLHLNRPTRSLSGGEAQRIRLATQIGSELINVLYILDEPSIGLHQRDNIKLIQSLKNLRDLGNSIIVVEHDKDMILSADYILDIGPGAGKNGGEIISAGTPAEICQTNTTTAAYLNHEKKIAIPNKRRVGNGLKIVLNGAHGNNLNQIDLHIPLGKMICITGVSGSGKSTLINETLYPAIHNHVYKNGVMEPLPFREIKGLDYIDKVIDIDQSPIGRTPRSNPATYTGVFGEIRELFAQTPEAKIRGYKAGRFSFNVMGGRCETCEGSGMRTIEMNFLPDIYIHCESCHGKRFNRETLEVRYKGHAIADILAMTIDEAVNFFEPIPRIYRKIQTLQDVGLGYVTLGQSSVTLSGGEAQRIKLATELSKISTGKTLYILDEPTTGLHFEDVKILLDVLLKLVDKGNSMIIIEHNLDVIKTADWIIDIGPEGGPEGGNIIAEGTPEEVADNPASVTGTFLRNELS